MVMHQSIPALPMPKGYPPGISIFFFLGGGGGRGELDGKYQRVGTKKEGKSPTPQDIIAYVLNE